jgi:hypothetical protein
MARRVSYAYSLPAILRSFLLAGAALGAEPRGSWPGSAGHAVIAMGKAWPPTGGAGRLRRVRSRAYALWYASPLLPARVGQCGLVGIFDEDEGGPLHNGRAGANEGDIDIFDLAFTSTS